MRNGVKDPEEKGRCRIYHDPVAPVQKAPAEIGWDAWFRRIDLVTPRNLKGKELLMRTRGFGEQGELMVEFPDQTAAQGLSKALSERFEKQVFLTP
jgi:hypothetical protein